MKFQAKAKWGQLRTKWKQRERADEYMMKNMCQYQPFIARREQAELFNSLLSSLTFSVLSPVQMWNI